MPPIGDHNSYITFNSSGNCNVVKLFVEDQYTNQKTGDLGLSYCASGVPSLSSPSSPLINSGVVFNLLAPNLIGAQFDVSLTGVAYPTPNASNQGEVTAPGVAIEINLNDKQTGATPTLATLVTKPIHGKVTGFPKTTVTYTPTSGFTGSDSFRFTLSNINGSSSVATVNIQVVSGLAPQIRYNLTNELITNTQTTVSVGQQVSLTAILPVLSWSSAVHLVSQNWLAAGKPIGGYTPTTTSYVTGAVLPWVTKQLTTPYQFSTTLYWTVPTNPDQFYTVDYDYTLSDGQSGIVETQFAVTPAPTPVVSPSEKMSPVACNSSGTNYCDVRYITGMPGLWVGFGNSAAGSPNHGFDISASTPTSGNLQWVQIIRKDNISYVKKAGGNYKCVYVTGLDATYPYTSLNNITNDSPAAPVSSYYKSVSRSFSAQMYLMWTSSIANSIPVPLGSITWGFDESSQADNSAPFGGWDTPTLTAYPGVFSMNLPTYPTWKALSYAGNNCTDTQ